MDGAPLTEADPTAARDEQQHPGIGHRDGIGGVHLVRAALVGPARPCGDRHAWIRRCGGAAKCAAYNTSSHVLHSKGDSNVNEEEMKEMEEIEETARALYERYFQACKKF